MVEHNPRVASAKRSFIIEYAFPLGHASLHEMGFIDAGADVGEMEINAAAGRLNAVASNPLGQAISQLARWAAEAVSCATIGDPGDELRRWEYDRFSEHFVRFGTALITTALNEGLITVNGLIVEEEDA